MIPGRLKSKNIPVIFINAFSMPIDTSQILMPQADKMVQAPQQIRWEVFGVFIIGDQLAVGPLGDFEPQLEMVEEKETANEAADEVLKEDA